MACLLTLLPSAPLRPAPSPRDCCCRAFFQPPFHHHSTLAFAFANALSSNSAQNSSDILANSSNGCLRIKVKPSFTGFSRLGMRLPPSLDLPLIPLQRKMGALHGVLLSFLLLGSFHNDVASAEAAALRLDFFSEQEQQIEPRKGNCATCVGVVDETLGACGRTPNCVSSFDDRPSFFMAPWEFPGKLPTAFEQINRILLAEGGDVVEQGNRYIHAVFTDKDGTIDDLEFLFSIPSEDATVNIRSASRRISQDDYGRNRKRLDKIRQALTWEEVPVLRNRSRALFFLESPWDTFGPEPPPAFDHKDKLEYAPD